jgi:P27 family predicted phage terminase small subunit
MAAGRKPLPNEIKELQGTLEKSRTNFEATSSGKIEFISKAPTFLTTHEKKMYKSICNDLIASRVLENPDLDLVLKLVLENSAYYENMKICRQSGYVEINDKGNRVKRVEFTVAKDNLSNVIKIASELGLTPAARTRLKIGTIDKPKHEKSKLSKLLN